MPFSFFTKSSPYSSSDISVLSLSSDNEVIEVTAHLKTRTLAPPKVTSLLADNVVGVASSPIDVL